MAEWSPESRSAAALLRVSQLIGELQASGARNVATCIRDALTGQSQGSLGLEQLLELLRQDERTILAEWGRRLASQRENLIAKGVDPAELDIPPHPDGDPTQEGDHG